MFPDGRAIIEPIGVLYEAKTTGGEVIAASMDLDTVRERVNYAQPDVKIRIKYRQKSLSVEQYEDQTAPAIYRCRFGEGEKTGFVGAIDVIKDGKKSEVQLFGSLEGMRAFILGEQGDNEYYYVHARREARQELGAGGLEKYDVPKRYSSFNRLARQISAERARRSAEDRKIELKDGKFNVMSLYQTEGEAVTVEKGKAAEAEAKTTA